MLCIDSKKIFYTDGKILDTDKKSYFSVRKLFFYVLKPIIL